MHIATCRLFGLSGHYEKTHVDADGWPHYKLLRPVPLANLKEQERMLKWHASAVGQVLSKAEAGAYASIFELSAFGLYHKQSPKPDVLDLKLVDQVIAKDHYLPLRDGRRADSGPDERADHLDEDPFASAGWTPESARLCAIAHRAAHEGERFFRRRV